MFSEAVTGFGAAGLTIANGTLTSGSLSGSGTSYTFRVTPAGSGRVVTVRVAAGAARDAATNARLASNLLSVTDTGPLPAALDLGAGTLEVRGDLTSGSVNTRSGGPGTPVSTLRLPPGPRSQARPAGATCAGPRKSHATP